MDPSIFNDVINNLRNDRNRLLYESDKYMLPDFPITEENLIKVKAYRQSLRDFFQTDEINKFIPLLLPTKPDFLK